MEIYAVIGALSALGFIIYMGWSYTGRGHDYASLTLVSIFIGIAWPIFVIAVVFWGVGYLGFKIGEILRHLTN